MSLNFSLIFHEGPISRSYLNIFQEKNIVINEIFYLISSKYKYLPNKLAANLTFKRNNYYPTTFLKQKKFIYLLDQVTERFDLTKDFFEKMYNHKNINANFKKIIYLKSENVNNPKLINSLNSSTSSFFLFSSGGILKKSTLDNLNKKIIHIHPGYLPKVRGADAILWSVLKFNELASTSFIMNDKLDSGDIIFREQNQFEKFKTKDSFDNLDFYRLIFSFIDPIIRIQNIENKLFYKNYKKINISADKSNYFTFMNQEEIKNTKLKFFEN